MNVKNLHRAIQYFEQEPLRLDMGEWLRYKPAGNRNSYDPPCGTVACLAGSAAILTAKDKGIERPFDLLNDGSTFTEIAAAFFDLPADVCDKLFLVGRWPEPYYALYSKFTEDFFNGRYSPELAAYIKKQMVYILRLRVNDFIREHEGITT